MFASVFIGRLKRILLLLLVVVVIVGVVVAAAAVVVVINFDFLPMIPGDVHLGGVILHVTLQLDACCCAVNHQLCCAGSYRRWREVIEVVEGTFENQNHIHIFYLLLGNLASLCWDSNRIFFFFFAQNLSNRIKLSSAAICTCSIHFKTSFFMLSLSSMGSRMY